MAVHVGVVEYPDFRVLPNCPMDFSNGDKTALAGEVVACGDFFGVLDTDAADGDLRNLTVNQLFRVKKKSTEVLAWGDKITFKANGTATKNDYEVYKAVAGDNVHGYAIEAAGSGATDVLILGPFTPPYTAMGTIADLLAAIGNADAGQVVVADGSGGVAVTDWVVPIADGTDGQVLAQASANTMAFTTDTLKALVAGKAAGQAVVADGSNGVKATPYKLPAADGGNGTQLTTDGATVVSWGAAS